ncbi:MAG: hypothetical protein KF761_13580 [Salinibacterium sp.]|nr:hypothetical protein [Salinibacterium sp.]
MFTKFLAVASTLLIAGGLAIVAVAAPASAHHTDLTASAVCTTDGGWDVSWNVMNSENFEGKVTASNNAAVPVGTVLPANPYYYNADKTKSIPTTYVQHVASNAAVNLSITVTWYRANSTPTNSQNLTFSAFPAGCGPKEATPVAPDVVKVTQCNTQGSVTAKTTEGVVYATSFDSASGDYTVTATPESGYYFKGDADQVITFTGNVGVPYDCNVKPRPVAVVGDCVYTADGTAADRTFSITFDNTASNKAVLFQVVGYPAYDTTVDAGKSVTVAMPDVDNAGISYQVTADGQSFTLTASPCPSYIKPDPKQREETSTVYDCSANDATVTTTTYTTDYEFDTTKLEWIEQPEVKGTPVVSHRPLTADEVSSECGVTVSTDPSASQCFITDPNTTLTSWIQVAIDPRVVYTLTNTVTNVVITPSAQYTQVDAGKYIVTAVAAAGYELQPTASRTWTFFVQDSAKCEPPTLAIVTPTVSRTPATCTQAATYTIGAVTPGTVTWEVNGVKNVAAGTYKVVTAGDVTLIASPTDPKNGLDPTWTNPTVLKFPAASIGCELETLAYTGSGSIGQLGLAGGMVFIGIGGLFIARRKWSDATVEAE